jgi:hypothetical protein
MTTSFPFTTLIVRNAHGHLLGVDSCDRLPYLKRPLPQEMFNLAHMVTLDHNMSSRLVDHNLLVRKTQELSKLVPKHLRPSVNLFHPSHGLVSAGFPQSVDWQMIAGSPSHEV